MVQQYLNSGNLTPKSMFPVSMPSFFRKAIVVSTQMHCLHLLQRATWLMPQHDHCPFRPTSTFILILHFLLVAPTHWQTLRRIHMGLLQWGFWLKDSRRPHQILWELCCSQWFHFIPLACFSPNTAVKPIPWSEACPHLLLFLPSIYLLYVV